MEKSTKKRLKQVFTWAGMALLVLLLTVMPLMAKNEAEADGPQASILSATPEYASITTSLRGGGNLADQDDQEVNIPTGVKITEFLVKNGDTVTEGTPLATVDKTSVMAAIASVNSTMDYLQGQLEQGRDEKVDETISAVPGGRVKKIFAKEGESVQEVMLRDGALAVLSIDSMMAVQFETPSAVETGETVELSLADGTVIEGRVESNLDGTVVVTVEDEGYEIGQQVSSDSLGTGTLYIHNAWKATAHSGTISKIHTQEEKILKAGAKLFTLGDRDFTGQLQHRANQHREYEELLQRLLKMYRSGTIDAPCGGIVSGVDEDSAHLLSSQGQWEVKLLDNAGEGYRIVFLSSGGLSGATACENKDGCSFMELDGHENTCPERCTKNDSCQAEAGRHYDECPHACVEAKTVQTKCTATNHKPTCIHSCKEANTLNTCKSTVHKETCIQGCDGSENCQSKKHRSDCIKLCIQSDGSKDCPAQTHYAGCIEKCIHADAVNQCGATKYHYADCIERCISSESVNEECPATKHKDDCHYKGMTYTAYVALVDYVGSSELGIYKDSKTEYVVEKTGAGWQIVSPQLNLDLMIAQDKVSVPNPKDYHKNDIVLLITAKKNGKVEKNFVALYQKSIIGDTDLGGLANGLENAMEGAMKDAMSGWDPSSLLSGYDFSSLMGDTDLSSMLGGFSGYGNFGGVASGETENLHDLEGSTLLTVTPHKTMKLVITLDEQDIAKVSVGLTAKVKVEALKNREFTAGVTKVGISGTNSGGSSKFTVELLLDAAEDMLPGMSAAAEIGLETRENLLTLPVAAVCELHGKTVVYTALDEKTGEPSSPVEVTTGVSDGQLVEILSGISPDTKVYYSYYDTWEEDTSAEASRFTFG